MDNRDGLIICQHLTRGSSLFETMPSGDLLQNVLGRFHQNDPQCGFLVYNISLYDFKMKGNGHDIPT